MALRVSRIHRELSGELLLLGACGSKVVSTANEGDLQGPRSPASSTGVATRVRGRQNVLVSTAVRHACRA